MTPVPDRIRAEVARTLENHGIAPRRALLAAMRLVRGLALADRESSGRDPLETLSLMRDGIAELLQERGLPEAAAASITVRVIDWLRKNWGGRTLTRQWWGFVISGKQATGIEIDGELFQVHADPVKSKRGRELRAVVWGILISHPSSLISHPCRVATAITALIENEWATIYVPRGDDLDRQARNRKIHHEFSGLGRIDEMMPHGLSQSTLYAINKRISDAKEKREQPGLF